ncbi:MAG: BatD family protein [Candidatus Euphemobacter frigidus]|nr:BatD family protein [Candidatus Euphemobacter frigidus]MDP8276339.1 BatD family protein [Candidatus Euphemobacter frigidus]
MNHRLLYFLIVFFILTSAVSRADEVSFSAAVNRNKISLSDQLIYTLTIEGARDGQPVLPDIPDFKFLGRSVSTQFSLINNQTRVSKSIDYTLMPISAGTFTIPSARLAHGGKSYTTRPIKVIVVKSSLPPSAIAVSRPQDQTTDSSGRRKEASPPPESGSPLFVRTEVDKKEAYVNEQITLTFKLFFRGLRIANLKYSPPPTIGFVEENLDDQKSYSKVVGGVRYDVVELSKAIFPISSGEVTIGPAELRGDIIVPRRSRSGSLFDDFFRDPFGERQPFALRSKPIQLIIKPLSREGRPGDFKGAVGEFGFELSAKPTIVKVGEPITVTMKVTGAGNLDTVTIPEIPCGEEFKTYVPEVETRRKVIGARVGGEKIFKQVIIPLSVDPKEIPPVSFSYFNPASGAYRTITAKTIPITVEAAPDQGPLSLVESMASGAGRERIRILKKDILYIKDNPGHLTPAGRFYYQRPLYWTFPVIFLALLISVWGVQSRREKLRSDVAYARQVGASRSARKRFKTARAHLRAGDAEKYYGEIHRAFNRYLGDKFGLPSGAVSSMVVSEKLSAADVGSEMINEIESCFAAFDLARFAGSSADKKEMESFLRRVEKLIGDLEKVKIKYDE